MAIDVSAIYHGSHGAATKELYNELEKLGQRGLIALNLFRACKASVRAKIYRRKYKGAAYEKKNWSLKLLCEALAKAEDLPANWRDLPPDSIDYWRRWSASARNIRDLFVSIPPEADPPPRLGPWGWQQDPAAEYHKWVLYVDLPTGQVSFHALAPTTNHRYHGEWDGCHLSARRIIAYTDHVLNGTEPTLILPACRKCHQPIAPYSGGRGSDLCAICAAEPASAAEVQTLAQSRFAL